MRRRPRRVTGAFVFTSVQKQQSHAEPQRTQRTQRAARASLRLCVSASLILPEHRDVDQAEGSLSPSAAEAPMMLHAIDLHKRTLEVATMHAAGDGEPQVCGWQPVNEPWAPTCGSGRQVVIGWWWRQPGPGTGSPT